MNMLTSTIRLKHILFGYRKSSFVKNVFVIMSGSVIAQSIGFVLTPIISRLFSPHDFGIFGSFNSLFTIIAAGATLEYSQAIMLPREKEDAFNLFFLSCVCTYAVGILCLMICLFIPALVNSVMKTDGVWALVLLVVSTVVAGINQSCQAWCTRVKAFKQISSAQVIRSFSANGTQIGFGYLNGGATALIISNVLANIFAIMSVINVILSDLLTLRSNISWNRMKQLARDYVDFPMYSCSQNVINALSAGLPVLLLTYFYGIVVAGAYTFGVRILWTPMSLVVGALRQVLLQKAGEIQHQGGSLLPLYVKISSGLFILALFPSVVLFIWAPDIFRWLFGSQWHMAGEFVRSIVLWLMFAFCNLPAVLFARFIRIQRTVFLYDLLLLAARMSALVLGGLYLNVFQTIMLFSLVGAVMNVFLILLVGRALIKNKVALPGII
ncbi:MAG: hypothetical protein A2W05_00360 [Candidatus Schekmanbacteria bacterium RBG_16_38_10]|uniref:Polysaccharide biosynthesis protein n=1 Tax=Candidatus Schekmanbacteria bacterium RBG_16_38_10 TaxID=1817879 RepID=A0A1F7RQ23_9BACT|nr:MAG: hypothetical protein A2W05_00360 [Candidatus Schekmanbacteria bacterium RBG_16_38_10]